jgi:hypothetical protein
VPEPIQIEVRRREDVWVLSREGREVHLFSHADEAIHEGVGIARALIHTGQPAEVHVEAEGKLISVDLAEPERVAEPDGADDEVSAIVPDRGPSA